MKILITGIGSIGLRHLRNLLSLGYKDIILYRTHKSVMEGIDKFRRLPAYSDLDDALAQKPNIAIISNPTSLHVSTALKCAKAGCDLFIEKPLSHNLAHLKELDLIARNKALITFIACQFRFHPHLIAIKKWLGDNALGRVIYASARWGEYLPDWHPWEDYRKGYSALGKLGGGAILTLIHCLDYMYWLFGNVSNVLCIHDKLTKLEVDVEDIAEIVLDFKNKVIGHLHLDYFQKPRVHDMLILAEKKRLYWNCYEHILCIEDRNGKKQVIKTPEGFQRNTMFMDELSHFLNCVKKRRETLIPLKEGIDVLRIALKAKERGNA